MTLYCISHSLKITVSTVLKSSKNANLLKIFVIYLKILMPLLSRFKRLILDLRIFHKTPSLLCLKTVLQSLTISQNVPVSQQSLQVHSLAAPTKQPLKGKKSNLVLIMF